MPEWRFSFELPPANGFAAPVGHYPGIIGVTIGPKGHVIIAGRNRGWVMTQAESFVRKIAPYGFVRPVPALLSRDAEPGPTISGPLRPAVRIACTIDWDGREAHLIEGGAMRQLGPHVPRAYSRSSGGRNPPPGR